MQASTLPASSNVLPVEGGSWQLNGPLLMLDTSKKHDNSPDDFCGSSQAPSSLEYDSGTPTAWSLCSSSPFSDFSGYLNTFGDMSFTAMLNMPLPYFPTTVPSSTTTTQNSAYLVPYASPSFDFLGSSLFEAMQGVTHINHSSSSTSGLSHPWISNQTVPVHFTPSKVLSGAEYPQAVAPNVNYSSTSNQMVPPYPTPSNMSSGAEYLQAVALNVGCLGTSNPCLMISAQMAPNHIHFTPSIVLNRTDQLHADTSGPQSSEAPTTAHLSQLIPVVVSCPPSTNNVSYAQQPASASQSKDPLALPVAHDTHNLNTADNLVPLEASPSEAENVAEIHHSVRRPVLSTHTDLANFIGGNAQALQASTIINKKGGNTDPSNPRGAKWVYLFALFLHFNWHPYAGGSAHSSVHRVMLVLVSYCK